MIDRGRQARFAHEALAEGGVLRQAGRDELQRDGAVEIELNGPVDHAHAAPTGDAGDAMTGVDVAWLEIGHNVLLY